MHPNLEQHAMTDEQGAVIAIGPALRDGVLCSVALGEPDLPEPGLVPKPAETIGDGELVLVVDDDDEVRNLTSRVLELKGYTTLVARDSAEAMELFGAHVGSVRAMVSDVVMPGMQGPALASHLRASHPGFPVLLMSGYSAPLDGLGREPTDPTLSFLQKPFTPNELAQRLGELLVST